MFENAYAELPENLRDQREMLKKELEEKRGLVEKAAVSRD